MALSRRACAPVETVLPTYDVAAAGTARLLHDRRFLQAWRYVDPSVDIAPAAMPPADPLQRLCVHSDAGVLELLVAVHDRPSLGMATARADAPVPAAGRLQVLQRLAAEAWFGPALRGLEQLGLSGARVQSLEPVDDTRAAVPPVGWCTARGGGVTAAFAVQRLPQAAAQALGPLLAGIGSDRRLRAGLALAGAVALARRPVRLRVLRALAAGDVLLMSGPADDAEPAPCQVRWGQPGGRCWLAPALVDEQSITIKGAPQMSDDNDTGWQPADGPDALAELEVPVRFEVETVPVALGDLEAMAPGYVIELSTPLAAAQLRLVACGRVIGQAELVAVGDRLGARIIRMAAGNARQSLA